MNRQAGSRSLSHISSSNMVCSLFTSCCIVSNGRSIQLPWAFTGSIRVRFTVYRRSYGWHTLQIGRLDSFQTPKYVCNGLCSVSDLRDVTSTAGGQELFVRIALGPRQGWQGRNSFHTRPQLVVLLAICQNIEWETIQ